MSHAFTDIEDTNTDQYKLYVAYVQRGEPTSEQFLQLLRRYPLLVQQVWVQDVAKIPAQQIPPFLKLVPTLLKQAKKDASKMVVEPAKLYPAEKAFQFIQYAGTKLHKQTQSHLTYEGRQLSFAGNSRIGTGRRSHSGGFGYTLSDSSDSGSGGFDMTNFDSRRVDNGYIEMPNGKTRAVLAPLPTITEAKAHILPAPTGMSAASIGQHQQPATQQDADVSAFMSRRAAANASRSNRNQSMIPRITQR